jgi:hypothetical protein
VSKNRRPPAADVIDQFNAINRPDAGTFGALDKNWFAAYRPKGPGRRIYAAGDSRSGASEEVA